MKISSSDAVEYEPLLEMLSEPLLVSRSLSPSRSLSSSSPSRSPSLSPSTSWLESPSIVFDDLDEHVDPD